MLENRERGATLRVGEQPTREVRMAFGARPHGEQMQALHGVLGPRDCPLCNERDWDFQGAEIVLVMNVKGQENARRRLNFVGARDSSEGAVTKRALEEAAKKPLIRIPCDNCGHTELLDARKLGA